MACKLLYRLEAGMLSVVRFYAFMRLCVYAESTTIVPTSVSPAVADESAGSTASRNVSWRHHPVMEAQGMCEVSRRSGMTEVPERA